MRSVTKRRRPLMCSLIVLAVLAPGVAQANAAQPEFAPPLPNTFAGASGPAKLQTVGGLIVTCEAGEADGEASEPSRMAIVLRFIGCTSNALPGSACQTGGKHEGEIVTRPLVGELGYLSQEPVEAGLDLTPATEGPLLRFFCGEDLGAEVVGSVIGRIGPINRHGFHMRLRFAENAGRQARKSFIGGDEDVPLLSFAFGEFERAGLAVTEVLTFASKTGIVA